MATRLSEAAAEILNASRASAPKAAFGDGTHGTQVTPPGNSKTPIELNTKAVTGPGDDASHLPDGTKGVGKATPPGATPPVGAAPMPKLPGDKDEQKKGKNKTEPGDVSDSGHDGEKTDIKIGAAAVTAKVLGKSRFSVKEDVDALLSGDETFSEDFKVKAATLFEAAVTSRVNELAEEVAEEFEARLAESVETVRDELAEKVNEYLNYVVENWVKENEVAIEKGLKTEILEGFLGGLHKLFSENYIEVPESKTDLVEELTQKVSALEDKLNKSENANVKLTRELSESKKDVILNRICEGLTATQSEKIKGLAESVDFDGEESFTKKVGMLKESYFPAEIRKGSESDLNNGVLLEENNEGKKSVSDPLVEAAARFLGRTAQK